MKCDQHDTYDTVSGWQFWWDSSVNLQQLMYSDSNWATYVSSCWELTSVASALKMIEKKQLYFCKMLMFGQKLIVISGCLNCHFVIHKCYLSTQSMSEDFKMELSREKTDENSIEFHNCELATDLRASANPSDVLRKKEIRMNSTQHPGAIWNVFKKTHYKPWTLSWGRRLKESKQ